MLRKNKLIPRVMTEYDMAALLDVTGIKVWQWRQIHQCTRLFMNLPKISIEEKPLRECGAGYGAIKHGIPGKYKK